MSDPFLSPESLPFENEIHLQEVTTAIKRHWVLITCCVAIGLLIGIVDEFRQHQNASVRLVVSLNKGPRVPSESVLDSTDWLGKSAPTLVPLEGPDEAKLSLEQLIPQDLGSWDISPMKLDSDGYENHVTLTVTGPWSMVPIYQQKLQVIAANYRKQRLQYANTFVRLQQPSEEWTRVLSPVFQSSRHGNMMLAGGLIGFIVGLGSTWLLDQLSNRVFRLDRLQLLLGYPLMATLPAKSWEDLGAQAQLGQLSLLLHPDLSWRILSIAKPHVAVEQLLVALQRRLSQVDLKAEQPLLLNALLPSADGRPLGVLLVVERGFNSAQALLEARRMLEQMPFVQRVGLLLAGEPQAPELPKLTPA